MYLLNFSSLPKSNFIVLWNDSVSSNCIGFSQKSNGIKYCNCLLRVFGCSEIKLFDKNLNLIKEF